jgi:dTDP-4-amino-4,6-dideoxygalactose transaminase
VHSPLSLRAAVAGLVPGGDPPGAVRAAIDAEYAPLDCILTDSGTSALRLAIEVAASQAGGSDALVALPAYCCYDVATAADGAEVGAVLYDLDPATLSPDPVSLDRAMSAGAAALVVAHLYGFAVDLDLAARAAAKTGALLIEDAAQGVGGSYRGVPLGKHGSLSVLSFGRGKGRTGGRGGALLANDERGKRLMSAARARIAAARVSPSASAKLLAQWGLARPGWYRLPASLPFLGLGDTVYRPPSLARRMDRLSAATLAATWGHASAESEARRANARRLIAALQGVTGVTLVAPIPGSEPGYLRLPALLADSRSAREARSLGIAPGYPTSLADLEGFGSRRADAGSLVQGARSLAGRLVTLPTHGWLREDDIAAIRCWAAGQE